MFSKDFLSFLHELSANNNRDWFAKHKKRYDESVKKPFEGFVGELVEGISEFDPAIQIPAKRAIFRIYRDTRFSKDKTPYKTHVSAAFAPKGRFHEDDPGYYLHIEAGRVMLGGGAYAVSKQGLLRLRRQLSQERAAFEEVIEGADFKGYYGDIRGEAHKRLPKEFKVLHKEFPLIANKQFYYMAELPPETALRADFMDAVLSYYRVGFLVNDYLRKAFV
jgi:uncharacterized protein (TIGR02453 family)